MIMIKTVSVAAVAAAATAAALLVVVGSPAVDAFHASAPVTRTTLTTPPPAAATTALFAYVPDGFTPESYRKFKEQEAAKKKKDLGRLGPKGFQSRSMQSFQEALERGEAAHLMPVFNSRDKIARGEIRAEDVPYMQRGGKWDNSDIKGARNRKKWLASDKAYAAGGYRKEQSVSILGIGGGLDWTGSQRKTGPGSEGVLGAAPKFSKNYKPPNVNTMNNNKDNKDKKKGGGLFGMF